MWINDSVLACFLLIFFFSVTNAAIPPVHCAYKNGNMQLNVSNLNVEEQEAREYLMKYVSTSRGTFLENGYERCDTTSGTSYCYSFWILADDNKPRILKQGCWLSSTTDCENTRCSYEAFQSSVTLNQKVNFCCCHGSKCNELEKGSKVSEKKKKDNEKSNAVATIPRTAVENVKDTLPETDKFTYCAYRDNSANNDSERGLGQVMPDGKTAKCPLDNYCFSFWEMDPTNKSRTVIVFQGCWTIPEGCDSSVCVPNHESHNSHKLANSSNFCCCSGNLCNNNISKEVVPYYRPTTTESSGPEFHHLSDASYKERTIMLSLLSVFLLAVIILVSYLGYRFCLQHSDRIAHANNNVEVPVSPAFDIEDLKICSLINKGRYSEVWKGSLHEEEVAVKIYNACHRQYYFNEKYIYSLPHMEHANLLKFYGAEERLVQEGNMQYLIVLSYIKDGTLMNYLKNNTVDWNTMCKMCHSLAKGLAHLHSDSGTSDNTKPTVAHRDFNSRNILVKPDLCCVIADLGFCMSTRGSKLIHKGHTENAEQTSLTDVGTLRYMAPELLDGAVNLRDCEASLKQIDMYSFGLVMWEIASRCSDLYQGCPMPEFTLPFHAEVGSHPTFEEMQLLVSRNKVRPKFPEVWKDYNPAIRALKETIEECWDHDAEARLTALCVEERIIEMNVLWAHYHDNKNKGVTPTINTALLSSVTGSNRLGYHGNGMTQWSGVNSNSDSVSPNVVAEGSTSALIINDIHSNNIANSEQNVRHPPSWINDRSGSISTSTVETVVPPTPVEPLPSAPKSQNTNALKNQPVPAHQGRNPTVERNTHKRSDEELAVVGNSLHYSKDRDSNSVQSSPPSTSDNMFDGLTDSLETSLMQNDVLNRHRNPPISYLQNHVNSTAGDLPPKMVNNPSSDPLRRTELNTTTHLNQSGPGTKNKKAKELGFLGHLAILGKLAFGSKFEDKHKKEDSPSPVMRMDNGVMYESIGQNNPIFEPSQTVDTEVQMTDTGPVVRPASLSQAKERPSVHENSDIAFDEVKVDKHELQNGSPPMFSRLRGAPYSKSTSDLSPQKTSSNSRLERDIRLMRPSTLSLKGHNYHISHRPSNSLSSLPFFKYSVLKGSRGQKTLPNGYKLIQPPYPEEESTEKIKAREKTPLHEKKGRLSLYDDRLMTDMQEKGYTDNGDFKNRSNVTLQQFKGVEPAPNQFVSADCTC